MTTARDLIEDAAAEIGELAADTSLSAFDANRMLRRLQQMIDGWALERLMVYTVGQESFAMTPGTASYTTASLSGGRPVAVESVFVRNDSTDSPVLLTRDKTQYDMIPDKTTTGLPELCYYDAGYTTGTFYFWPAPVVAYTCFVTSRRVLTGALALTTSITLPPGYERAIVTNLAVESAPMFGRDPSASTVDAARKSKAALKVLNYVPGEMQLDYSLQRTQSNILTGYY